MTVRVLTYHSHNISGNDYATNDHVALGIDLPALHEMGVQFVPLAQIVAMVRSGRLNNAQPVVGLSFDDGPVFDFADFVHEQFGPQRSFANILRDFTLRTGTAVSATSFVIASPEARRAMEEAPDCGYPRLENWLGEAWWKEATNSAILTIGNHSWDHVHHAPIRIAVDVPERDNFALIRDYISADTEIRKAADYISARTGQRCTLFAYPFGHVNDFLVYEYFPERASEHGMIAAFSVGDESITSDTSVWNIPRLVCGHHWKTPGELARLVGV